MPRESKALKGHKCAGVKMSVHVNCECGWTSANWSGPGARSSAYSEWRRHVKECEKAAAPARELKNCGKCVACRMGYAAVLCAGDPATRKPVGAR